MHNPHPASTAFAQVTLWSQYLKDEITDQELAIQLRAMTAELEAEELEVIVDHLAALAASLYWEISQLSNQDYEEVVRLAGIAKSLIVEDEA